MKELIYVLLEQSKQSLAVYKELMKNLRNSHDGGGLDSFDEVPAVKLKFYHIIADNCIQMAAVNWCKVFASKKSKTYYATGMGSKRKQFLGSVEARGISFQETCDKMRSFRDKYSEEKYSKEEVEALFQNAMDIVELYETVRRKESDQ